MINTKINLTQMNQKSKLSYLVSNKSSSTSKHLLWIIDWNKNKMINKYIFLNFGKTIYNVDGQMYKQEFELQVILVKTEKKK